MFVSDPNVPSIDQHIVAVDQEHLEQLKNNPLKINPNLERDRMLTNDYYHKYPFGTLHYLITRMCREGIDVRLPDLNKALIKYPDITLGKLLLRPDDAMYSSLSAYKDNAIEWWEWLIDYSKNSKQIIALRDYIYNNEFPDDGASEHKAVIGSTCNLRAGAGYNYKVVTVLEQGTPITVIGEVSKGWYHVSCDAGEGYIGTRFVDFG